MSKYLNSLSKYKIDLLFIIFIALTVLFLSKNFSLLHIQGSSMYPTYNDNEILIVKKNSNIENNDLAIFMAPTEWNIGDKKLIKRTVAGPGDTLSIEGHLMKVNNGEIINVKDKRCQVNIEITLGVNEYFMVGDNYSSSNDSLTQLCDGNEQFLVKDDNILFSGEEMFVIGGF